MRGTRRIHHVASNPQGERHGVTLGGFLCLWLLLGGPGPVAAAVAVFGPTTYVRATGTPVTISERFGVCRPDRPFVLRVENGPRGATRLGAASVVLNGREVLTQSELNQQVSLIERPVTLREANTLAVTLGGTPLGTLAVSILSPVGCGLEVGVTAPVAGSVVATGRLVVRGTVRGAPEVGVTVNEVPAALHGEAFAALVPVGPDAPEVVAVATTADGTVAEARVPLTVTAAPEAWLSLRPAPAGGPAPLAVRFGLSALGAITRVALDLDGDGVPEFDGPSLPDQPVVYTAPGVYLPRVTVTDDGGATYSSVGLVHVYDQGALETLLQAKWTALEDALSRADVAGALAFFSLSVRERYREQLDELAQAGLLGLVAADLARLTLVRVTDGAVEYDLRVVRDGVEESFFMLFVRDTDGIWRLRAF